MSCEVRPSFITQLNLTKGDEHMRRARWPAIRALFMAVSKDTSRKEHPAAIQFG
jgi:hypothetical protein